MRNLVDIETLKNIIKFYELYGDEETPSKEYSKVDLYNFDTTHVDLDKNLNLWEKNKQNIFNLFNDKLKVELPLDNISQSEGVVYELLNEFLQAHVKDFNVLIILFLKNLSYKDIIANKLTTNVEFLNVLLEKNWKISKCFKILELNKERLEKQQILYSQFLQSLQIKGKLVLSIDPIDFITMSCNRSGWSSCHHPNASYGTGGLSYMNDSSTIIAYITTDKMCSLTVNDTNSPNIEPTEICFTDKLWRQVVNISPNFLYAIQSRQYPNDSHIYNQKVSEMLITLFKTKTNYEYISSVESVLANDTLRSLQNINSSLYTVLFYNDIVHESFNKATVVYPDLDIYKDKLLSLVSGENEKERLEIGEKIYCMCGCQDLNYTRQYFRENYDSEDEYDDDGEPEYLDDYDNPEDHI